MTQEYIEQLEETITKQSAIIETLRKTNHELVNMYNELASKYNTVAGMLNACGVRETKMDNGDQAWCLTMQIGDVPNPKEALKETGIDTNVKINPAKPDGDNISWSVSWNQ